jgi:hypothetical protein
MTHDRAALRAVLAREYGSARVGSLVDDLTVDFVGLRTPVIVRMLPGRPHGMLAVGSYLGRVKPSGFGRLFTSGWDGLGRYEVGYENFTVFQCQFRALRNEIDVGELLKLVEYVADEVAQKIVDLVYLDALEDAPE